MTTGLVLGKFYPPTMGHQYLIDFAQNYVDKLYVIIGDLSTETIPGIQRQIWLRQMVKPSAEVILVPDNNPIDMSSSDPMYWQIWKDNLLHFLPIIPDYLFASEGYGWKLAEVMGMKYIPVNHDRTLVRISATQIRENPMEYWKYIPPVVRPYFVKRVCIYGAESTGKTTLTNELAGYYNTVAVEEYARGLLDFSHGTFTYEDMETIARGHKASEEALAKQASKVMFIDTDLLTTKRYSLMFFKKYPEWFDKEIDNKQYDLRFLTDIDVPWEKNEQRYFPEEREEQYRIFEDTLISHQKFYFKISGNRRERLEAAIKEVDKLF